MGWGTGNLGGGSGGLNFKVVGGTSEPSSPKENIIWVNTSNTITDWVFSATQPSAKSGRVWISTGTSSNIEFNALKKNGIQVYPISAKQYVSGAWVYKTAKSYQGGKWVDWWNGELYDYGNEWERKTGGWYISQNTSCTLNKNADSMVFHSDGVSDYSHIAMNYGADVPYNDFTKVHILISKFVAMNESNSNISIVFKEKTSNSANIAKVEKIGSINTDTIMTLNIPTASKKTLCVGVYRGTATIKKIWME